MRQLATLEADVSLDPAYWFIDVFLQPDFDTSELLEAALAEASRLEGLPLTQRSRKLRFRNALTLQQQLIAETGSLIEAHKGESFNVWKPRTLKWTDKMLFS